MIVPLAILLCGGVTARIVASVPAPDEAIHLLEVDVVAIRLALEETNLEHTALLYTPDELPAEITAVEAVGIVGVDGQSGHPEAASYRLDPEIHALFAHKTLRFPLESGLLKRQALEVLENKVLVSFHDEVAYQVLLVADPSLGALQLVVVNTDGEDRRFRISVRDESGAVMAPADVQLVLQRARLESGLSEEELLLLMDRGDVQLELWETTERQPDRGEESSQPEERVQPGDSEPDSGSTGAEPQPDDAGGAPEDEEQGDAPGQRPDIPDEEGRTPLDEDEGISRPEGDEADAAPETPLENESWDEEGGRYLHVFSVHAGGMAEDIEPVSEPDTGIETESSEDSPVDKAAAAQSGAESVGESEDYVRDRQNEDSHGDATHWEAPEQSPERLQPDPDGQAGTVGFATSTEMPGVAEGEPVQEGDSDGERAYSVIVVSTEEAAGEGPESGYTAELSAPGDGVLIATMDGLFQPAAATYSVSDFYELERALQRAANEEVYIILPARQINFNYDIYFSMVNNVYLTVQGGGSCTFSMSGSARHFLIYGPGSGRTSTLQVQNGTVVLEGNSSFGGGITVQGSGAITLSGLTIQNCGAASGGGISFLNNTGTSYNTLQNCIMSGNQATGDTGGAVSTNGSSNLSVKGGSFTGNRATGEGGAIYAAVTGGGTLRVEPLNGTGTLFRNNSSSYHGGAISAHGDGLGQAFVTQAVFEGNTAAQHAGALFLGTSSSQVTNATFMDNEAGTNVSQPTAYGGAIFVMSPVATGSALVTTSIKNCAFTGNWARQGGAVHFHNYVVGEIIGSAFIENHANETQSGARGRGGAFSCYRVSYDTGSGREVSSIENCTFTSNSASYSGGAAFIGGSGDYLEKEVLGSSEYVPSQNSGFKITGSTFENNTAGLHGGALHLTKATYIGDNSTLSGNQAKYGGAIYLGTTAQEHLAADAHWGNFWVHIQSSSITGNTATMDGGGIYVLNNTQWDRDSRERLCLDGVTIRDNSAARAYDWELGQDATWLPGGNSGYLYKISRDSYYTKRNLNGTGPGSVSPYRTSGETFPHLYNNFDINVQVAYIRLDPQKTFNHATAAPNTPREDVTIEVVGQGGEVVIRGKVDSHTGVATWTGFPNLPTDHPMHVANGVPEFLPYGVYTVREETEYFTMDALSASDSFVIDKDYDPLDDWHYNDPNPNAGGTGGKPTVTLQGAYSFLVSFDSSKQLAWGISPITLHLNNRAEEVTGELRVYKELVAESGNELPQQYPEESFEFYLLPKQTGVIYTGQVTGSGLISWNPSLPSSAGDYLIWEKSVATGYSLDGISITKGESTSELQADALGVYSFSLSAADLYAGTSITVRNAYTPPGKLTVRNELVAVGEAESFVFKLLVPGDDVPHTGHVTGAGEVAWDTTLPENLRVGDYTIWQETPTAYSLQGVSLARNGVASELSPNENGRYEFNVSPDNLRQDIVVTVRNEPKQAPTHTDLTVTKRVNGSWRPEYYNAQALFTVTLTLGDGKIYVAQANADGVFIFNDYTPLPSVLPLGECTISEMPMVSMGYELSHFELAITTDGVTQVTQVTDGKFEINRDTTRIEIVVHNVTPMPLRLRKVAGENSKNGFLPGAEFTLYKCDDDSHTEEHDGNCWSLAATATSDVNGLLDFQYDVRVGEQYLLVETRAPEGRQLPLGGWLMQVDEQGGYDFKAQGDDQTVQPAIIDTHQSSGYTDPDGQSVRYWIPNLKASDLPLTGFGRYPLYAGGAMLLLLGTMLAVRGRVRNSSTDGFTGSAPDKTGSSVDDTGHRN